MSNGDRAPNAAQPHHVVYLGLGSNLGDRDEHLRAGLRALSPAVVIARVSSVFDTAPLLLTDQPRFHNIVCIGRTALAPDALLRLAKRIEHAQGRAGGLRYGPRPLDIDILFYDDLILRTPELTLPHPGIAERAFVLLPLAEIAPDLRHPLLGADIRALASKVRDQDARRAGALFAPAS
jgi:2-amino-4-hydroxy-6-hydroxymethyldihydropteridine diphosphokinase